MHIDVNGEAFELPEGVTVAELVDRVGLGDQRVALERNREIVPRGEYKATRLADGDRIEIVRAIGGG